MATPGYRLRRTTRWIVIATCVLAFGVAGLATRVDSLGTAHGSSATASVPAGPWSTLLDRTRADGHARVIVTLRLPASSGRAANGVSSLTASRPAITQVRAELVASLHGSHATVTAGMSWSFPLVALDVDATALQRLRGSPLVAGVELDSSMHPADMGSDSAVGAPQAWSTGYTGANQTIAVLDTGVQEIPPVLGSRLVAEACFSGGGVTAQSLCPNGQLSEIGPGAASACSVGLSCIHGTAMVNIAAGDGVTDGGANYEGVAPQAHVIAVQVYSASGPSSIQAYESDVISGLNWVSQERTQFNISVVNLSFAAVGTSFASACDGENPAMTAAIAMLRSERYSRRYRLGQRGSDNRHSLPGVHIFGDQRRRRG